MPGGHGVRLDTHVLWIYNSANYDSMIAKLLLPLNLARKQLVK
jgi:hypothetical protein